MSIPDSSNCECNECLPVDNKCLPVDKPKKKYSKSKGAQNTAVNSIPIIIMGILGYINRKYNLGFDETVLTAVMSIISIGFYHVKNWIKNK